MRRFSLVLSFILAVLCLAGTACSAGSGENSAPGGGSAGDGTASGVVDGSAGFKIVYTVDLSLETNQVSAVREALTSRAKELGGWLENSYDDYDGDELCYASLTLRIPTAELDAFLADAQDSARVTGKSMNARTITTEYVTAQAKLAALGEEKTALEELLSDTGISAADRITVISKISEINAEIQAIELTVSQYDSLVEYSTVNIRVRLPADFTAAIVAAVVIGVIVLGVVAFIVLEVVKKKKRKKQPEQKG